VEGEEEREEEGEVEREEEIAEAPSEMNGGR